MARSAGPDRLCRGGARDGGARRGDRGGRGDTSGSGWSSTRRSTPPARAPRTATSWTRAFPSIATGRGGQYTYHGPGQRVAYVMLDLKRRRPTCAPCRRAGRLADRHARAFGVGGETREDRVGVWVCGPTSPPASTERRPRTRSPPSACASAAGSPFTASRSTSSRT